jgi:hypothetical protein
MTKEHERFTILVNKKEVQLQVYNLLNSDLKGITN